MGQRSMMGTRTSSAMGFDQGVMYSSKSMKRNQTAFESTMTLQFDWQDVKETGLNRISWFSKPFEGFIHISGFRRMNIQKINAVTDIKLKTILNAAYERWNSWGSDLPDIYYVIQNDCLITATSESQVFTLATPYSQFDINQIPILKRKAAADPANDDPLKSLWIPDAYFAKIGPM